jgi:putative ABC transport system permease protein
MLERYRYLLIISLEAVKVNRYRSVLTALGIIFGVASVIAMMAIGRGAQKAILDQMKLVGINNIIITPAIDLKTAQAADSSGARPVGFKDEPRSPGLTVQDVQPIADILPNAVFVSPEINLATQARANGKRIPVQLTGVTPGFFKVFGLTLVSGGIFTERQSSLASPVCIIGPTVRTSLFPGMDPLGNSIKCGNTWLRITGILGKTNGNTSSLGKLGISDFNSTVYIPLNTMQGRFGGSGSAGTGTRSFIDRYSETPGGISGSVLAKSRVDKIVVQVSDPQQMTSTAPVLKRVLKRLHNGVEDFKVVIPELLLKNEKRARNIFSIVLSAIAGISLLVGGIGIMNIMMTSVVERTKEIGVRLSIGAKKKDIVFQFLAESAMISLAGGVIGILLGVVLAQVIRYFAGIPTVITLLSVLVSFGISVTVGIVFGYLPAKRASQQDPVASLRYE